jgi:triosephosphate isomerase
MKEFIVNFKAYKEGIDLGRKIAKTLKIIPNSAAAPPFSLLKEISNVLPTYAQRFDPVEPGAFTGHITWYEIKRAGAIGSLINHSEYRVSKKIIEKAAEISKAHGLRLIICVKNLKEAKFAAKLRPYAVAYEPPKLIGGDISVTTAEPKIVREFVEEIKRVGDVKAIIGAGIKTHEDIIAAHKLGADGVLIASGVVNKEYYKHIKEFSLAYK